MFAKRLAIPGKGLLIIYSKENCSIVTKFDTSLQNHKICIDEIKLKQLLFNLISNAENQNCVRIKSISNSFRAPESHSHSLC